MDRCRLCENPDGTLGPCRGHELLDAIVELQIDNSVAHKKYQEAQFLLDDLKKEISDLRRVLEGDDLK